MRWVLLFRGVNVGGQNKLPMAALRGQLDAAGFADVESYIQSGNVVLSSPLPPASVKARCGEVVEAGFGIRPGLLVLGADELDAAIEACPFAGEEGLNPSHAHLFFHMGADLPDLSDLAPEAGDDAVLTAGQLAHYLVTPGGMSRSKLAEKLARRLKDKTTARNWRTCLKLQEMCQQ